MLRQTSRSVNFAKPASHHTRLTYKNKTRHRTTHSTNDLPTDSATQNMRIAQTIQKHNSAILDCDAFACAAGHCLCSSPSPCLRVASLLRVWLANRTHNYDVCICTQPLSTTAIHRAECVCVCMCGCVSFHTRTAIASACATCRAAAAAAKRTRTRHVVCVICCNENSCRMK